MSSLSVTGPLFALPGTARTQRVLSKEQTVARLFDAFSRRCLQDALPLLTDDIVFAPMTAQLARAGEPYRGHEGMRRYMVDVEEHWEELTLRPTQIKAAGDAVVALGLVSGRGPAGAFEDAPTTWTFKFRGEQVAHAQIFSHGPKLATGLGDRQSSRDGA